MLGQQRVDKLIDDLNNPNSKRVLVVAHRGDWRNAPENSLQAFQNCIDIGVDMIELDLHMSKDSVLFLIHDNTLNRTTNGHGILEEMNSSQIDSLRTKQDHPILRMDELARFFDGKDSLYVEWELKSGPQRLYPRERLETYVEKVYQTVQTIRTRGSQFVFTSSDYRGLRYLQEHHPEAELLLIIGQPLSDATIATALTVGIHTLGCTMQGTSREMVAKAHKAGITVSLWPGQSVEDFMLGAYLGADRMCTDVPIAVKQWVEAHAPWLNVKY